MTQARDVTAATDHLKLAQHSVCIESNSVCLCAVWTENSYRVESAKCADEVVSSFLVIQLYRMAFSLYYKRVLSYSCSRYVRLYVRGDLITSRLASVSSFRRNLSSRHNTQQIGTKSKVRTLKSDYLNIAMIAALEYSSTFSLTMSMIALCSTAFVKLGCKHAIENQESQ